MNDRPLTTQAAVAAATRVFAVPRVRPVMQMLLPTDVRSEEGRRFAMKTVLDWAAEKWPTFIPRAAWDGEDFEHDEPGLEIGAVSLPERGLWGFRVEHPDTGIPGRVWMLEALVASADDRTDALGVRSQCTASSTGEVPGTSPRFLRTWIDRLTFLDAGYPIASVAEDVSTDRSLDGLIARLRSSQRQLPVVVISQSPSGGWAIEADRLARRASGLAHVVRLAASQSVALAERVGRELSVFNGAVRTYLPGVGQPDDTQIHANFLPPRISAWRAADGEGSGAFLEFLVAQLHRFSVGTPARLDQMLSYVQLRRFKAERERASQLANIEALKKDLESRPQADQSAALQVLRAQLEERQLELDIRALEKADAEKKAADAEALFNEQAEDLSAVREERDALRSTNANLLAGLKRLKVARGEAERLPATYDEIAEWADQTLSDRLSILGRARRSLKEAVFQDVMLVVRCLLLLSNEYWRLRTAEPANFAAARLAFDSKLQELEVDEAPSISVVSLGKLEEHYTVNYTIGYKSKQILDRHLRGGSNTKDDRYCMRIYFFWDDDQQKVVVGHLPSHLDTLAT